MDKLFKLVWTLIGMMVLVALIPAFLYGLLWFLGITVGLASLFSSGG